MFDKNAQTKLYNTLMGNPTAGSINNSVGRTAGLSASNGSNKNFFEKKASSIGNAVGTTVSAGASLLHDIGENIATKKFLGDSKSRMNDVAKKYGYNSYQDVWDARDRAEANGDTATLDFIDNTINPELQAQANANAEEATAKAKGYEDYRKNNLVSKNINQDNAKFLGSAINTLSTAVDIAGLGANPLTNAIQGGIEGIADELEQNGGNIDFTQIPQKGIQVNNWDNFDIGRAGQNALIGAASGAVTGAVNNTGVMKNLGQGKIAQNVFGSKLGQKVANNAVGNAIRTVGTGAVKGAISGAVGGATGAGLSSAINGVDLGQGIANTFQGAAEGAKQGALTGGVMAGANMAISKTPGVGDFYNELQSSRERWNKSGNDFDERLTNTLTSGDSKVGDWLMGKTQSKVLGAAGSIGNSIRDYTDQGFGPRKSESMAYDDLIKDYYEDDGIEGALRDAQAAAWPGDSNFRKAQRLVEGGSLGVSIDDAFNGLKSIYGDDFNPNVYLNKDGSYKYKNGEPYVWTIYKNKIAMNLANKLDAMDAGTYVSESDTPTTAKGWLKKAGERIVEDANNRGVGMSIKNVSDERVPLDESMRRINNVRGGDAESETIGKLPLEYMYGDTESPNIEYISRIANEKIMAGDAKNLSVAELAYSTNNYNRAKIIEFDKNGTGRLNIVRPLGNGKAAVIALEKQPDGNTLITTIRPNVNSNYVKNLTKNKGANVLYDTTGEAATAFTTGAPAASRAIAGGTDSIIPQSKQNVNPETEVYRTLTGDNQLPTSSARTTWDDLAREYGYKDYNEVSQKYLNDNPNSNPDATDILDWLDRLTAPMNNDVAKQRLRNIKAEALRTRAAEDLLNQVGTAKAPAAKADNMIENVKQFMDEGLTKPEEWQLASDAITGANGVMSRLHRNLVSQAGNIDTYAGLGGKYGDTIDETIDYIIKAEGLVDSDAKGIKNEIMAVINSLPSRIDGSISSTDSAESVMDGIRELEAHRRNYLGEDSRNRSTTTPYKDQKARVIKKVTSMLEDRIYDNIPDAKTVVTQDAINELKSYFPNNKKWQASVDKKFDNIKTGKDLRAAQKRYVQTSDYLRNIKENYGTYGQRVGDVYGNALSQAVKKVPVIGGLLAQATNTPFMNRRYADINMTRANKLKGDNIVDSMANIPSRKSIPNTPAIDSSNIPNMPSQTNKPVIDAVSNPSTQIFNAIGREIGQGEGEQARAAAYLSNAVQEAETAPTSLEGLIVPSTGTATSVYNNIYGQPSTTTTTVNTPTTGGYFQATGDYWTDLIGRAMSRAIDEDDVTAFATLYGMYQDALSKNSSDKDYSNPVNWSSTDRKSLLQAQNGLDQIDSLEQSYINAVGDGSNVMQGTLRQWANNISGGNLDPSAENYVKQANSIGAGIIKNLVNLGSTEYDAERYIDYLPKLTDTKEQAAQKLQVLRDAYNNVIGNLETIYNV